MEELTHWKRLWCWQGLGAGGEGDDRGWDGWMALLTWWTWVWVNSGSWWWTGRPGMLRFMGSQRVGTTEWLNWTELNLKFPSTKFLLWYHHPYRLLTALLAIMLSHSVFSEQWTHFTVMLACEIWRWNCWARVAECETFILLVWLCRCDVAPESTILAAASWSQAVLIAITVCSRRTTASLIPDDG